MKRARLVSIPTVTGPHPDIGKVVQVIRTDYTLGLQGYTFWAYVDEDPDPWLVRDTDLEPLDGPE